MSFEQDFDNLRVRTNCDIERLFRSTGVLYSQVMNYLGFDDGQANRFLARLRIEELSTDEKERIKQAINDILDARGED